MVKGGAEASGSTSASKREEGDIYWPDVRFLIESAAALLWIGSPDGTRRWIGTALSRFSGMPPRDLARDNWTRALHPEDVDRCRGVDSCCLPVDHRFTLDYRLRCHDGFYRWMMDTGTPCHAKSGAFAGHIGVCVEIDERRGIEDRLAERLHRARAASRR